MESFCCTLPSNVLRFSGGAACKVAFAFFFRYLLIARYNNTAKALNPRPTPTPIPAEADELSPCFESAGFSVGCEVAVVLLVAGPDEEVGFAAGLVELLMVEEGEAIRSKREACVFQDAVGRGRFMLKRLTPVSQQLDKWSQQYVSSLPVAFAHEIKSGPPMLSPGFVCLLA